MDWSAEKRGLERKASVLMGASFIALCGAILLPSLFGSSHSKTDWCDSAANACWTAFFATWLIGMRAFGRSKGYPYLGEPLALLWVIGLIILACLPDRRAVKSAFESPTNYPRDPKRI